MSILLMGQKASKNKIKVPDFKVDSNKIHYENSRYPVYLLKYECHDKISHIGISGAIYKVCHDIKLDQIINILNVFIKDHDINALNFDELEFIQFNKEIFIEKFWNLEEDQSKIVDLYRVYSEKANEVLNSQFTFYSARVIQT